MLAGVPMNPSRSARWRWHSWNTSNLSRAVGLLAEVDRSI
jgi:hypothetical protein